MLTFLKPLFLLRILRQSGYRQTFCSMYHREENRKKTRSASSQKKLFHSDLNLKKSENTEKVFASKISVVLVKTGCSQTQE